MKRLFIVLLLHMSIAKIFAQSCDPIDHSFGTNGQSIGLANSGFWNEHGNLLVQPDNKIIQISSNSNNGFTISRHKVNGNPDSSFGINGKVSVSMGPGCRVYQAALQNDGKILVTGAAFVNNYKKFGLIRLTNNGTPDPSFGTGGIVITSLSSSNDEAHAVAIQTDGKIIVAGNSSGSCFTDCVGNNFCKPFFTILRYQANGLIDSSFAQNGKIAFGIGTYNSGNANAVVIQPDGKIVVAGENFQYYCDDYYGGGTFASGFFMTRLNVNGTVDTGFGQNGQVRDTLVLMNTTALVMQPDGKFVVTGYQSGTYGYMVRRYDSNGTLDNSFSQSTVFNEWITSMCLKPDGKIVLGGQTYLNGQQNFLVARLKTNGTLDSSFNIYGKTYLHTSSLPGSEERVEGVASQGNYILAGGVSAIYYSGYQTNILIVRISDTTTGIAIPVSPQGPIYLCPSTGVTISTSVPGTYQWYLDNILLTGATGSSYTVTSSGSYSVAVTNSNDCGHSAPVTVYQNGLPVSIIPASSTSICSGDSVKLSSSEVGQMQWFFNSSAISNATDSFYWAKNNGSYTVSVKNSKGCGLSSGVYVTVNPPKPFVNWNGTYLSTSTGYTSYQWYLNGTPITGATTPNYTPSVPGLYKVLVNGFLCSPFSDELNLNCSVINVQQPVIGWTGTQLLVSSIYSTYQWYLNNNPIPNAINAALTVNQIGTYKIVVTGKLGCSNVSTDFILNCNDVGPAKPSINWNGTQFSTNPGYTSYQWYLNDTAITGAVALTYAPPPGKFGRYKVEVSNNFNCYRFSDERYFAPTSIVSIGRSKFTYYPNPVSEVFYIDVISILSRSATIELYDLNGKKILQQTLQQGQNQIQVKRLPVGLYHLEIRSGGERIRVKVAVAR